MTPTTPATFQGSLVLELNMTFANTTASFVLTRVQVTMVP